MTGKTPVGQVWDIISMASKQTVDYDAFFSIAPMSMGIYKLAAGSTDNQTPHNEDEAYFVVNGKASIEIEDDIQEVKQGSLIFVAAGAAHRFVDIAEDLTLLVFFAPAYTG